jgi:hypothetical protein
MHALRIARRRDRGHPRPARGLGDEEARPMSTSAKQFSRNRAGNAIKLRLGTKPVTQPGKVVPLATFRCRDVDRYLIDRYGRVLPDDDAARDDIMIMLHHIAYKQAADRQWLMNDWLDQRAPWLTGNERAAFIRKVFAHPIRYEADTLAEKLGLTFARRQRLGITTIGAIDMSKEQREERRKAEKRQRKRNARRKSGCMPRTEYEANSVKKQAQAEGISPRTWYRRQKHTKTHYGAAAPVPHIARVRIYVTTLQ